MDANVGGELGRNLDRMNKRDRIVGGLKDDTEVVPPGRVSREMGGAEGIARVAFVAMEALCERVGKIVNLTKM